MVRRAILGRNHVKNLTYILICLALGLWIGHNLPAAMGIVFSIGFLLGAFIVWIYNRSTTMLLESTKKYVSLLESHLDTCRDHNKDLFNKIMFEYMKVVDDFIDQYLENTELTTHVCKSETDGTIKIFIGNNDSLVEVHLVEGTDLRDDLDEAIERWKTINDNS